MSCSKNTGLLNLFQKRIDVRSERKTAGKDRHMGKDHDGSGCTGLIAGRQW